MLTGGQQHEFIVVTTQAHLVARLRQDVAHQQSGFVGVLATELVSQSLQGLEVGPVGEFVLLADFQTVEKQVVILDVRQQFYGICHVVLRDAFQFETAGITESDLVFRAENAEREGCIHTAFLYGCSGNGNKCFRLLWLLLYHIVVHLLYGQFLILVLLDLLVFLPLSLYNLSEEREERGSSFFGSDDLSFLDLCLSLFVGDGLALFTLFINGDEYGRSIFHLWYLLGSLTGIRLPGLTHPVGVGTGTLLAELTVFVNQVFLTEIHVQAHVHIHVHVQIQFHTVRFFYFRLFPRDGSGFRNDHAFDSSTFGHLVHQCLDILLSQVLQ